MRPYGRATESVFRTKMSQTSKGEWVLNRIIYIVGAVVIVLFILGLLGLR